VIFQKKKRTTAERLFESLQRVNTKYVKVSSEKNTVVVNNYLEKGNITKVAINTDDKTIETTIVLAR
jgi:hypothetical protein